jgi:hypothetical protein
MSEMARVVVDNGRVYIIDSHDYLNSNVYDVYEYVANKVYNLIGVEHSANVITVYVSVGFDSCYLKELIDELFHYLPHNVHFYQLLKDTV